MNEPGCVAAKKHGRNRHILGVNFMWPLIGKFIAVAMVIGVVFAIIQDFFGLDDDE